MDEKKQRMTNERDFKQVEGYISNDPEKEKLVLELGMMITDRYLVKYTKSMKTDDPEYWALDHILTKEEVKFLLSFKKTRVPYLPEQIAERNNMTLEEAQKHIDHLVWVGMLEMTRENPEHKKQYNVPIFVPGSAEFMMMNDRLTEEHPELATFFNLMTQMPLEGVTKMIPPGGSGVGMHVIPVEKAIEHENKSVSVEHISHWLKKYDKYSVGQCTCRKQQTMRGEGTGEINGEFCMGVGDMAEYCVDRGMGRYITYEEALEILQRAEDHGFVHQITNIDGEDKIVAICNCAPGVCNAIRTSQLYNTPNMSRSAYRAHVDKDKCVACGKCVEVCPVGAAKLGQKLCKKDGTEVEYPLTELPDNHVWGEDKWNKSYREDAKINVYEKGTAPCKTACPAHLAVQGYIKMALEGRYREALELIKSDNPLPVVCGAICNRRCEEVCTRGTIDRSVAIDEIKKFIASKELESDMRFIPKCENDEGKMWGEDYKMAVIGSGPAGLSCAYYLRVRGYDVTVFEKEPVYGGMLMHGVPNFRLEKDLLKKEIEVLEEMGVEFKFNTEVGKDVTIPQLREQGYKAFYVAIGFQGGRKLGIPGEENENVIAGVDFLYDIYKNNDRKLEGDTIVIGGGNVAMDVARTALRAGKGNVTVVCLEQKNEMPAAKDELEEAEAEGIIIKNGFGPVEIKTENGKVTSVICKRCTRVYDENGKFDPIYDESDLSEFKCSNVLLAIGQSAKWGNLLEGTAVELNKNGTAIADPVTFQTSEKDIFVGGDVYRGPAFAIDAIADGKKGCESMHRFVHEGQSLTIARDLREFRMLDRDDIRVEGYDNSSRQVPGMKNANPRDSFSDNRLPFTEEQVKKEAARCLGCGATIVDLNRCIGCGLCTTRCKFDAIHLTRDLPHASDMVRCEDKLGKVGGYALKRMFKVINPFKNEKTTQTLTENGAALKKE